jgi:hypothetical protein
MDSIGLSLNQFAGVQAPGRQKQPDEPKHVPKQYVAMLIAPVSNERPASRNAPGQRAKRV